MLYSSNKDFDRYIQKLVRSGQWSYIPQGRGKHGALRHVSGTKCPVPRTPSNHRGILNFRCLIRKMERLN